MASAKALGEISRRIAAPTAKKVTIIGSIGATATATFSASAPLMNGFSPNMMAAIGKSTIRDQCTLAPSVGFSLYCRRSNQSWPAINARTCAMRRLSSVSPSPNH